MLMNRRDSTADFVGRHCYCPDLFLSASDIVRIGAVRNCPHLILSASRLCPSLLNSAVLPPSLMAFFFARSLDNSHQYVWLILLENHIWPFSKSALTDRWSIVLKVIVRLTDSQSAETDPRWTMKDKLGLKVKKMQKDKNTIQKINTDRWAVWWEGSPCFGSYHTIV